MPELHTGIHSDGIMLWERGRFRITADKLESIVTDRDETLPARPGPIATVVKQNAKVESDEQLCDEGFSLWLVVLPPKR